MSNELPPKLDTAAQKAPNDAYQLGYEAARKQGERLLNQLYETAERLRHAANDALARAEQLKAENERFRCERDQLRAVANAAIKVRSERVAFLAIAKAVCPVRSPALEQAEAEMDAVLDGWIRG